MDALPTNLASVRVAPRVSFALDRPLFRAALDARAPGRRRGFERPRVAARANRLDSFSFP
jgi:hypothetical protein